MEKHQVVEIRIIPDFNRDGKVDVDFYLKGVDGPMNLREFEGSFRKAFFDAATRCWNEDVAGDVVLVTGQVVTIETI